MGRYILAPEVIARARLQPKGAGGEIQLTDAIAAPAPDSPIHAIEVPGVHIHAGTPAGLLSAAVHEARRKGIEAER